MPPLRKTTHQRADRGQEYLPEDLKGKGEPSFSIERALKGHPREGAHRRGASDGGVELADRSHWGARAAAASGAAPNGVGATDGTIEDRDGGVHRTQSARGAVGVPSEMGNLRRRKASET